jgi:DNA repair protein RecO (recombination protein O)
LSRLYAGYYLAELLGELTESSDPHPELFDAADAALAALDGAGDVAAVIARFELTLLRYVGHMPELDTCVQCGQAVASTGRVAFGQLSGGVLCDECKSGKRQVASVSAEALAALRAIARTEGPWSESRIDRARLGEVRGLLNQYLANLLGKRPKMYAYLGTMMAS